MRAEASYPPKINNHSPQVAFPTPYGMVPHLGSVDPQVRGGARSPISLFLCLRKSPDPDFFVSMSLDHSILMFVCFCVFSLDINYMFLCLFVIFLSMSPGLVRTFDFYVMATLGISRLRSPHEAMESFRTMSGRKRAMT